MIRAIIFDLDDTLFPTRMITQEAVQPIIDAFIQANNQVKLLNQEQVNSLLYDVWRQPFNRVALKYQLSRFLIDTINSAVDNFTLNINLQPYEDYSQIHEIDCLKFLVTTGHDKFQGQKIDLLGIRDDFDEIVIDAVNKKGRHGKKYAFQDLLQSYSLEANETIVIGDSPTNELKAGKALGCVTVQIIREGVIRADWPDYHILHINQLNNIIAEFS